MLPILNIYTAATVHGHDMNTEVTLTLSIGLLIYSR